MDQQKKLYLSIAVLAVLGGLLFLQKKSQDKEASAHSVEGRAASLPSLDLTEEKVAGLDRIEIVMPAEADAGAPQRIVLKKTGDESWSLEEPTQAKANASNVKSLIDNLPKLSLSEAIAEGNSEYERWGVSDAKALHANFFQGDSSVFEVFFGDSGSRGQMTRIAGRDGVYAIQGFSKWLYERDAKGWRDKSMLKFDEKEAVKVTVENEHGAFVFEKSGESWSGAHGETVAAAKPLDKFQPSKVDDLLRAYKALSAMDFGDNEQPGDVGLAEGAASVKIELKGGKALHELRVGSTAEGSNRWAKTNASDQVYAISSWSADWATAEPSKFQTSDE
jgi:hypothetical protein